jgi:hypothetical protein
MRASSAHVGAFIVLATIIVFGPLYDRQTGGSAVLQHWDMFHRKGVGVCDAEFLDGNLAPLDRFALLSTTRTTAPRPVRRMDGIADVDDVTRRLCRVMGKDADVRVRGRCATSHGWVATHDPALNACKATRRASDAPAASEVSDGD